MRMGREASITLKNKSLWNWSNRNRSSRLVRNFGIGCGEPLRGIFALALEELGHGMAGGKAVLERGVDAAGRYRRDHAGRIAN